MSEKWRPNAPAIEYIASVWGIMSFALILVPLLMLVALEQVDKVLQPVVSAVVGAPIALVCTYVIAFYGLSLRDELYKYTRTLSFRRQTRPPMPIPIWALNAFIAAIVLAFLLAFGVTAKDQLVSPPGRFVAGTLAYGETAHMVVKFVMTGCLIFVFVFLSLSAALMAAYEYGKSIELTSPELPIYTDEDRLKEQVLKAACEKLGIKVSEVTVSDMKRQPDGGVSLTLRHKGEVIDQGDLQFREDKTWEVCANWVAELVQVEEKAVRQSKVEAFQIKPVLEAVQEILDAKALPRVLSMKRGEEGLVTLNLSHEGRAWRAKADRWSRLVELEEA